MTQITNIYIQKEKEKEKHRVCEQIKKRTLLGIKKLTNECVVDSRI